MYPQPVREFVEKVIQSLDKSGFLIENDVDYESATKAFSGIVFERWKRGDELVMTEEEAMEGMKLSIFEATMKSLIKKNMVDTIENQNGEPVYFLTKEGKKYAGRLGK
jgi:hypothetical protein